MLDSTDYKKSFASVILLVSLTLRDALDLLIAFGFAVSVLRKCFLCKWNDINICKL